MNDCSGHPIKHDVQVPKHISKEVLLVKVVISRILRVINSIYFKGKIMGERVGLLEDMIGIQFDLDFGVTENELSSGKKW